MAIGNCIAISSEKEGEAGIRHEGSAVGRLNVVRPSYTVRKAVKVNDSVVGGLFCYSNIGFGPILYFEKNFGNGKEEGLLH